MSLNTKIKEESKLHLSAVLILALFWTCGLNVLHSAPLQSAYSDLNRQNQVLRSP